MTPPMASTPTPHDHDGKARIKQSSTVSSSSSDSVIFCVAVVREGGYAVDVFDASGRARSFAVVDSVALSSAWSKRGQTGSGSFKSSNNNGQLSKKQRLCFSTHGCGNGADGLLTPCFDENGDHGEPEEGCFCGVDTPHLHAHLHDPVTCVDAEEQEEEAEGTKDGCAKKKGASARGAGGARSGMTDLGFLAQLTLHPVDNYGSAGLDRTSPPSPPFVAEEIKEVASSTGVGEIETDRSREEHPLICIPISDYMPKQCNSREFSQQLSEHGIDASDAKSSSRRKRMYKVQHDDHFDYLVHHGATGDLHLEHPCNDCGDTDLHGKLHLIGKRRWTDGMSSSSVERDDSSRGINLHFYEACKRPFHLREFMADFFNTDSSRVLAAVRQVDVSDHGSGHRLASSLGRKHREPCPCGVGMMGSFRRRKEHSHGHQDRQLFHAEAHAHDHDHDHDRNHSHSHFLDHSHKDETKLFCSLAKPCCKKGEFEKVPKICESKRKSCCVSENTSCCASQRKSHCHSSATRCPSDNSVCTSRMTNEPIKPNSAPTTESTKAAPLLSVSGSVKSHFFVEKICCASEIPAINSIIKPLPGVTKVTINTTVKAVYVDHDPSLTTANDICNALNEERFGAHIKKDGMVTAALAAADHGPHVGRSHFFVEKICCASEIPAIKSIVEPLPGVEKVSINVTAKTVYVDHDTNVTSALEISKALNNEAFGARVKKDAGQEFALRAGLPTASFVESTISIPSLLSDIEVTTLDNLLTKLSKEQLRSFAIHLPSRTVKVEHNPYLLSVQSIMEKINAEFVDATILSDGAADGMWAIQVMSSQTDESIEKHVSTVNPFVVLSGVFWVVSMFSYIGGNWEYLKYVALVSVAFGLPSIAMKAFRTLRRYQFDANCMMFFAAVGALALQEFMEAAAVTFLFAISDWLESRATARARNALAAIVNLRPDRANLVNPVTKEIVVVPAAAVAIGAIVSVRTGDKIPCDGVVIEGRSTVDESSLTGESRPVRKGPNDTVCGGTINSGTTQLVIRTTSTADNSAVARLIRLVEEAQSNRSQTEKLVDEFAKRYTPLVILIAVCFCTIPWAFGREVGRTWTMIGLVTIVIACPCALIISIPVTYVAGLAATAQRGILVKGGAHLEALGAVRTIAFDKTGTLTEGNFALLHLKVIGERRTRKELLEYLALVESRASHPLADALVAAAKNENVAVPRMSLSDHTILKGEGVKACVDGVVVHVGNPRLFDRIGLFDGLSPNDRAMADEWAADGGTVGFIGIDGEGIVGAYCVTDAVRSESKDVVVALKRLGIDVLMLTGDNETAALSIGKQVGLSPDQVRAQLLPEDKLELVSSLKENSQGRLSVLRNPWSRKRLVLMCGDGVNDAPALATADVGVAMGAGAALAMETSDVTLMDSNLTKLLYSIKMGRRVTRTIVENIAFSLLAKAVVMSFTFAGKTTLWEAIASDVGAMLIVTLNGMKLLPSSRKVKAGENMQLGKDGTGDIEESTSYAAHTSLSRRETLNTSQMSNCNNHESSDNRVIDDCFVKNNSSCCHHDDLHSHSHHHGHGHCCDHETHSQANIEQKHHDDPHSNSHHHGHVHCCDHQTHSHANIEQKHHDDPHSNSHHHGHVHCCDHQTPTHTHIEQQEAQVCCVDTASEDDFLEQEHHYHNAH